MCRQCILGLDLILLSLKCDLFLSALKLSKQGPRNVGLSPFSPCVEHEKKRTPALTYVTSVSGLHVLIVCFFRPQHNGKFCQGSSRLNQLCNTKPCQPSGVNFRAQQCAEYNSKPFRGWYYKWKPYTKVEGMATICSIPPVIRNRVNVE